MKLKTFASSKALRAWVMDAKREETRARRLAALITSCTKGEPGKPLSSARLRTG